MGSNTVLNRDFGHWDINEDPDSIYADNGCPIHPKCLECPLPMCVYDLNPDQQALQGYFNRAKKFPLIQQALTYQSQNHLKPTATARYLAELIDMTERSAFRLIRFYNKVDGDYARFIGIYGDKDRK